MNKKGEDNYRIIDKSAALINHERILKQAHTDLHAIINSSINKGNLDLRKSKIANVIAQLAVSLSII